MPTQLAAAVHDEHQHAYQEGAQVLLQYRWAIAQAQVSQVTRASWQPVLPLLLLLLLLLLPHQA
jgi:hypothetical protein